MDFPFPTQESLEAFFDPIKVHFLQRSKFIRNFVFSFGPFQVVNEFWLDSGRLSSKSDWGRPLESFRIQSHWHYLFVYLV